MPKAAPACTGCTPTRPTESCTSSRPSHRIYTLGEFFDEWGQPLGPSKLGPVKGHVVAIYNGNAYQGDPRTIPLRAHAQIQLQVGKPLIAPQNVTFPNGL